MQVENFKMNRNFNVDNFQTPDLTTLQKKRPSFPENVDEEDLIEIATEAFVKELGLDDSMSLKGKVEIREVSAGTYLMKEDSNKVSMSDVCLERIVEHSMVLKLVSGNCL